MNPMISLLNTPDVLGDVVETKDPFLATFLDAYFKTENYTVYPLAGDASNRRYYRVVKDNISWVLMRWEPFDPNNYPFLSVLNHFAKSHVHVPEVVQMSAKDGLVLLEDLGDLTLERKFWESQNQEVSLPFYKLAVDELIKIHFDATKDRSPCTAFNMQFDTEKLLWEMNYGKDNLMSGILHVNFTPDLAKGVSDVFHDICSTIHKEPKVIQHRDYHSRNVMLKYNKMRVIDFQDARLGAVQYDLVSLLKDSYVNMSDEMAETLIQYYLEQAENLHGYKVDRNHFDEIYEIQSIQRCFKACGSFASFWVQRKDTRYLKYISPTLKRVIKSLSNFPKYKVMTDLLIDSGALERNYEVL
jgi:aminoglycoside/choline kinase family phosphotransferase